MGEGDSNFDRNQESRTSGSAKRQRHLWERNNAHNRQEKERWEVDSDSKRLKYEHLTGQNSSQPLFPPFPLFKHILAADN